MWMGKFENKGVLKWKNAKKPTCFRIRKKCIRNWKERKIFFNAPYRPNGISEYVNQTLFDLLATSMRPYHHHPSSLFLLSVSSETVIPIYVSSCRLQFNRKSCKNPSMKKKLKFDWKAFLPTQSNWKHVKTFRGLKKGWFKFCGETISYVSTKVWSRKHIEVIATYMYVWALVKMLALIRVVTNNLVMKDCGQHLQFLQRLLLKRLAFSLFIALSEVNYWKLYL